MISIPVTMGAGIRRPDTYTKLHLRMNGTGQNFQELTGKTITVEGNTTQNDTYKKFIGNVGYFDGTGDQIVVSSNADLNIGYSNFTWEGWIYYITGYTQNVALGQSAHYYEAGYNGNWSLFIHETERYICFATYDSQSNAQYFLSSNDQFTTDQWYHIAVVRTGTGTDQTKIYRNGTAVASGTIPKSLSDTANGMRFGLDRGIASNPFYASEWRLSVGIARYISNFTPPTRRK